MLQTMVWMKCNILIDIRSDVTDNTNNQRKKTMEKRHFLKTIKNK